MKHPHSDIINQWLEDTTQEIEIHVYLQNTEVDVVSASINDVISNIHGNCEFRIKPKQDETHIKYKQLLEARINVETIEYLTANEEWKELDYFPSERHFYDGHQHEYRIKPEIDEYEFLRQAIRDGKFIEFNSDYYGWIVLYEEDIIPFRGSVERYRIYDPYRELKENNADGKRIVWKDKSGRWIDTDEVDDYYHISNYKIVEDDIVEHANIMMNDERKPVKIKLTKSGIDGTIKAEVIE